MAKRHHKRRAVQHIARHRRDELRSHRALSRSALILFACSAVATTILITVAVFGPPANVAAELALLFAFILAALTFIHTLVMRVLPVSKRRDRRGHGISERGIAYGVTPGPPYGTTGFDVHLTDHKDD